MKIKPLSPREEEIINFSIEGLSNDQIAERLAISLTAIHIYWLRIKLKLSDVNRTIQVDGIIKDKVSKADFGELKKSS